MGKRSVDIAHVRWIDSCSQQGWQFYKDVEDFPPVMCESVGYVVDNNEKYITLCGSLAEDSLADTVTIPKSCVKKVTRIGKSALRR